MVYEEAVRCGKVRGVLVPLPPLDLADASPSRVYIRFELASEATKCKEMMDGREFDDRKVCLNGLFACACVLLCVGKREAADAAVRTATKGQGGHAQPRV